MHFESVNKIPITLSLSRFTVERACTSFTSAFSEREKKKRNPGNQNLIPLHYQHRVFFLCSSSSKQARVKSRDTKWTLNWPRVHWSVLTLNGLSEEPTFL